MLMFAKLPVVSFSFSAISNIANDPAFDCGVEST